MTPRMTIGVEIRKLMMRDDLIAQEQDPLVNADFPAIAQRALAGDPHFSRLLQDMRDGKYNHPASRSDVLMTMTFMKTLFDETLGWTGVDLQYRARLTILGGSGLNVFQGTQADGPIPTRLEIVYQSHHIEAALWLWPLLHAFGDGRTARRRHKNKWREGVVCVVFDGNSRLLCVHTSAGIWDVMQSVSVEQANKQNWVTDSFFNTGLPKDHPLIHALQPSIPEDH